MNKAIFRQKSIDRISSPEKIDDYIRVNGVSMWLVLISILLILAWAVVWGFTGRIEDEITDENGQVSVVEVAPVTLLMNK